MKPFVVYLLRCADGTFYVGHTDDLQSRLRQHHDGEHGYTATRKPLTLAWSGEFETREGALAFELQIKGWSRAKKEALMRGDWDEVQRLAKSRGQAAGLRQAQPERSGMVPERKPFPVHPEPVEGPIAQPGLRQPQPEPPTSVHPELVEGPMRDARLRQAQPERSGVVPERKPFPVHPEPVEGPIAQPGLRQPQPEPPTSVHPELVEGPEPVEGPSQEPRLRQAQPERGGVQPKRSGALSERMEADPLLADLLEAPPPRRRRAIAKTITLLESTRADHRARADELLNALLPHTGRSFRLGISGVPGVGKSTFIEVLGLHLIEQGHRVAVLAVDPSSSVSGGSILGDKTRMEKLSVHEAAYIRPSPSSGTLGGVAERTRESLLVCEAAGYDVVIVETVGVGQSETAVAGMTDMFVLLQLPNAGDDLQAIKKGVMEIADLVVINKADLDEAAATRARAQITSALRLFGPHAHPDHQPQDHAAWHPKVLQLSALKSTGVDTFWQTVTEYRELQTRSGRLARRRHAQDEAWMWERIDAGLKHRFKHHPQVREALPLLTREVREGQLAASVAARRLLELFR